MNKYIEMKNKIKQDMYTTYLNNFDLNECEFTDVLENKMRVLWDEIHTLFRINSSLIYFDYVYRNMMHKFIRYLTGVYLDVFSIYRGECNDDNDTCICICFETISDIIACKHIMNTSRDIAKSYKRHFDKLNRDKWNDEKQTGLMCNIISRNYCTNHMYFETSFNTEYIDYDI